MAEKEDASQSSSGCCSCCCPLLLKIKECWRKIKECWLVRIVKGLSMIVLPVLDVGLDLNAIINYGREAWFGFMSFSILFFFLSLRFGFIYSALRFPPSFDVLLPIYFPGFLLPNLQKLMSLRTEENVA